MEIARLWIGYPWPRLVHPDGCVAIWRVNALAESYYSSQSSLSSAYIVFPALTRHGKPGLYGRLASLVRAGHDTGHPEFSRVRISIGSGKRRTRSGFQRHSLRT